MNQTWVFKNKNNIRILRKIHSRNCLRTSLRGPIAILLLVIAISIAKIDDFLTCISTLNTKGGCMWWLDGFVCGLKDGRQKWSIHFFIPIHYFRNFYCTIEEDSFSDKIMEKAVPYWRDFFHKFHLSHMIRDFCSEYG